jgi:hypothetical protein
MSAQTEPLRREILVVTGTPVVELFEEELIRDREQQPRRDPEGQLVADLCVPAATS